MIYVCGRDQTNKTPTYSYTTLIYGKINNKKSRDKK